MSIPNRQIGWSQESNLLWQIAKQLEKINTQLCCGTTTTTTTTACPCNTWELSASPTGATFEATDCIGNVSILDFKGGQTSSGCYENVVLISTEGTGTATNLHDCCPIG